MLSITNLKKIINTQMDIRRENRLVVHFLRPGTGLIHKCIHDYQLVIMGTRKPTNREVLYDGKRKKAT